MLESPNHFAQPMNDALSGRPDTIEQRKAYSSPQVTDYGIVGHVTMGSGGPSQDVNLSPMP